MENERYAVVDVETTGFSPVRDRVVEVGCVLVDGDRIVDRWSSLVDPGIEIPGYATAVHGITGDMVAGAPPIDAVLARLRSSSHKRTVVAHNAPFDVSFVGPDFAPALCTLRLARILFPEAPDYRNQTLRRYLRIDNEVRDVLGSHRALDDATVTAHVLLACRRRFRQQFPGQTWRPFVRAHALIQPAAARAA